MRSVGLFVRSGTLAGVMLSAALCAAPVARADAGDLVMAEVLFRDGRELLARKDYARACPKLAESYRLDAATGTLLALALCHEGQGKLASAWGEYVDAASRSRVERRPDREAVARARATELEPKYSTVTVVLADGSAVPGLEIRRNGVVVAPAWLGTAIPVDGGGVTIDAAAPARAPWRIQIAIAGTGDHPVVTVPPLEPAGTGARPITPSPASPYAASPAPAPAPPMAAPPAPVAAASAPAPPPSSTSTVTPSPTAPAPAPAFAPSPAPEPPPRHPRGLTPLQISGAVLSAIGVAVVGVGAAFTVVALQKNDDSRSQCAGDLCTDAGKQSRKDALNAGNVATASFIAGPVVAAVGVAFLVFGRRGEAAPPSGASIQAVPLLGPGVVGGSLRGDF